MAASRLVTLKLLDGAGYLGKMTNSIAGVATQLLLLLYCPVLPDVPVFPAPCIILAPVKQAPVCES